MDQALSKVNRHDFVYADLSGRLYAFGYSKGECPKTWLPHLEELILERPAGSPVPAIVRRQEKPEEGNLQVGFSSWLFHQGSRFRVPTALPLTTVERVLTPYEILKMEARWPAALTSVLAEVRKQEERYQVAVGLTGAAAMELLTRKPYLHEGSDVDLIVDQKENGDLEGFFSACVFLSRQFDRPLDLELQLPDIGGVKLAEWLSDQKTVLVKGFQRAEIRLKAELKENRK
ncbi:malonate decarboxylase holo-[acyl-carrier-protein] synthase [Hominifimenecus sp. rT4P-3]|uniref:malonate decarboxylase holo-[acyl-carrier-protein] synthase n=1 Tax=Hominifimenecus sp. rT4P-3 TaxID=3242979 RepID=UPI003DA669FA